MHCDVKPANILLDSDGCALLTDFGIVQMMRTGSTSASTEKPITKSPEMLIGTPEYISPEQALGQPLDGRSAQQPAQYPLHFTPVVNAKHG